MNYCHGPVHDAILNVVGAFPHGIETSDIAMWLDRPVEYVAPRVCELYVNHLLDAFEPRRTYNAWCIPTEQSQTRRAAWDDAHGPRTNWKAAK